MWRNIKKYIRKNKHLPYGKCFVSFAYEDYQYIDKLKSTLKGYANLFIFPPINVPPEKMVSNNLLSAIRESDSLIYFDGGKSNKSPWVTLERDYALRSNLEVFSFNVESEEIIRDNSKPIDLPVYISYSRFDRNRIDKILEFMRRKRYFDVFQDISDSPGSADVGLQLGEEIINRLKLGGYVVTFLSRNSIESRWVQMELERAISQFQNRVLPALIEEVYLPEIFKNVIHVKLFRENSDEFDMRRVDDLIVHLYWLIQNNTKKLN